MKEMRFIPVGDFEKEWKGIGGSANDLHRLYVEIERLGIHGKPLYGNLRVVRGRIGKTGKSGGVRVAYFYFIENRTVFLFAVYDRRKQDGFTKEELVELDALCEEIKGAYKNTER
ncbi:MAG: hypothetical protein BMS9Abin05_1994 [Rhodothermia bacterium]|nr:MAG: hypothetical protein BMS9Abin05_1994 [Rhodothermia bacterium]